ncbi:hypothetical protein ACIBSW_28870 [Actinoplanes sp. NPDC049668]|uniref:hypothetical protein n=1 Tax=unclassified Actinoplanes TaxID=2626549 RepID=UPI0033A9D803
MRTGVTWTRVAGVAAALIVGCLGSAAAVRAGDFPGPPGEPTAIAAATTAIGRPPAGPRGPVVVCDYWCPDPGGEGVVSFDSPPDHTDTVAVTYDLSPARAAEVEAAARARLEAAGWRPLPDGELTRDGLAVALQVADTPAGVRATVVAAKTVPPAAVAQAAAGFVLGTVLGGLLAARAAARFRRQSEAVRALAGTLTVLVIAVTFGYAITAALLVLHGGGRPPGVQLAEFLLTVFPKMSIAVLAAAAAALALIALPPRRKPRLPGPATGQTESHGAARS